MSIRRLSIALIGAAGLLLATAATVWACSPNALIRLPISSGPAGTSVTLQGEAFDRGAVRVEWVPSGQVLLQTTGPTFAVPVTIPENAPAGVHYIEALGFNEAGEQVGHTSIAFTVEAVPGDTPGQGVPEGGTEPEPGPVGSEPEPGPVGSEPEPGPVGSEPEPEPIGGQPEPVSSTPAPAPATTAPDPATTAPDPATTAPDPATTAPDPAGSTTAPDSATTAPEPATTAPQPSAGDPAPLPAAPEPAALAPAASAQPATTAPDETPQPSGTQPASGAQQPAETLPAAGDLALREHVVPRGIEPLGQHDDAAAIAAAPSQRTATGDLWSAHASSGSTPSLASAVTAPGNSGQHLQAVGPAALGIGMVLLFGVTFTLVARRRGVLVGARTHSGDVADR